MGDGNLMSFKRPAKQREIEGYIGNLESIVGTSTALNNDSLLNRMGELKSMKSMAENKEREAYKLLGVKGLRGLQSKVNQINQHLLTFSNKSLSKMPIIKTMEGVNYQTLENELHSQMESGAILKTLGIAENYEDLTEEKYLSLVYEKLDATMKELRGTSRTEFGKKVKQNMKNEKGKKKVSLKGYKKELEIIFGMSNPSQYSTQFTIETTPENEVVTNITYYPYAFLTDEQKTKAISQSTKEDKTIWLNFKKQLSQCCGPYGYIVEHLLGDGVSSQFKVSDFLVSSPSEAKGILGELQTAIILTALTGKTADFFGNTLENAKKIGVDVALSGVGFQVKNYNIISSDTWEGFRLGETITLDLFLNKLEEHGLSNDMVQNLGAFYSIKAYNIAATDNYMDTQNRINSLYKRINLWLQGYGTAFLPLRPYKIGENLSIANIFYFVGGQRILPISKIIECYINFIEKLMQIGVDKTGSIISYSLISSGVPQTYVDYYEEVEENKEDKNLFVGYKTIYDALQMKYNMNITLPSISKMMQQYVNKI